MEMQPVALAEQPVGSTEVEPVAAAEQPVPTMEQPVATSCDWQHLNAGVESVHP